jgi:hypothetical protein
MVKKIYGRTASGVPITDRATSCDYRRGRPWPSNSCQTELRRTIQRLREALRQYLKVA